MMPISEITTPAIARPLGALNNPIQDKINPTNHTNHPKKGIQLTKIASNDIIKPAVPIPFELASGCLIMMV